MSDILSTLATTRLVPVAVVEDPSAAGPLGQALVSGGLSCVEVTFRTAAAVDVLREMAASSHLLVGAGTVLRPDQVDAAVAAGARFIVSPGFSPAVVRHCRELGVPVLPGVATATEIMAALDEGVDVVKFFPAEQCGGVPMLRALTAPLAGVRFVPTGGVTAGNMADYLGVPSVIAVGGSWMVAPKLIAAKDWSTITSLTAEAVALAEEVSRV